MANVDSLTGVDSRLNILSKIESAIAEHEVNSQKLAVLMFDVDKFKLINDNHGHTAGDEVLKFLSERIRGCLRESDSIGRVGGDEFIILIRNINTEAYIEKLIYRIFEVLRAPLDFKGQQINVNISVGISILHDYAQNADSLINQADFAMYEAKKESGCSHYFYSVLDDMDTL